MTPQEIRRERLRNDHREMQRIHSDLIQVEAHGNPPERYGLKVRVKSITSAQPTYRGLHEVEIVLPSRYPMAKPEARMVSRPQPFHPNWWPDGRWCSGDSWNLQESLGSFVLRMVRTLQFDPDITNPNSPANQDAAEWYEERLSQGIFPCDRSVLPDPNHNQFTIQPKVTRFTIH